MVLGVKMNAVQTMVDVDYRNYLNETMVNDIYKDYDISFKIGFLNTFLKNKDNVEMLESKLKETTKTNFVKFLDELANKLINKN